MEPERRARGSTDEEPGELLPSAMESVPGIKAVGKGGVPQRTPGLAHLRASQINGCSASVYGGVHAAKKAGETDERLWAVAAWREAPFFTDAERVALALAEAMVWLSDRPDAIPDEVWDDVADHFGEPQLAALILLIAATNLFNRINATLKSRSGRV